MRLPAANHQLYPHCYITIYTPMIFTHVSQFSELHSCTTFPCLLLLPRIDRVVQYNPVLLHRYAVTIEFNYILSTL